MSVFALILFPILSLPIGLIWHRVYKFEIIYVETTSEVEEAISEVCRTLDKESVPDIVVEDNLDPDLVIFHGCRDVLNVRRGRKMAYSARVSLLAKSQVGLLKFSKANQMVYQRICRDEMIKHGLRPTHIAKILPLAVASCFIKTFEEELAEKICEEACVRDGAFYSREPAPELEC